MDKFVHEANLKHYLNLLAGATHEAQRPQILELLAEELELLAEEIAKDQNPFRQIAA